VILFWWQRAKNETEDNETTCDRPDNPYTVSAVLARQPNGVRLDYIMYRANAGEFLLLNLDSVCVIDDYEIYFFQLYLTSQFSIVIPH